jgi:phage FluMu protein Com
MVMRRIREGEVPPDGATALQEDPDRPVFRGNGRYDYVCVEYGNVLAHAMDLEQMTKRVRVKCGRCRTINVAVVDWKGPTLAHATSPAPEGSSARDLKDEP